MKKFRIENFIRVLQQILFKSGFKCLQLLYELCLNLEVTIVQLSTIVSQTLCKPCDKFAVKLTINEPPLLLIFR